MLAVSDLIMSSSSPAAKVLNLTLSSTHCLLFHPQGPAALDSAGTALGRGNVVTVVVSTLRPRAPSWTLRIWS